MNPSDLPDETLFEGALKCRTPQERGAYLDEVCDGQPELRQRLEALLAAHDRSGEFLEPTVGTARPAITGTFTNVLGATSPYTNIIISGKKFFRLAK